MERVAEVGAEGRPDASRANEQIEAPPRDLVRPEWIEPIKELLPPYLR